VKNDKSKKETKVTCCQWLNRGARGGDGGESGAVGSLRRERITKGQKKFQSRVGRFRTKVEGGGRSRKGTPGQSRFGGKTLHEKLARGEKHTLEGGGAVTVPDGSTEK